MNGYHFSRRKRTLDIIAAIIGLALLAVLAVPIAFAAGWPVLYRQRRLGLNGREFTVTKFRTMVTCAERRTGPIPAQPDDPRVTRVGRILRRTHLDEMPQWWSVLRGDMSAVGPRPERPMLHDQYVSENPLWSIRLRVKPGLTGLAQVTTDPTNAQGKLGADMYYIMGASLRMDLVLMLRTVLGRAWPFRERRNGVPVPSESTANDFVRR